MTLFEILNDNDLVLWTGDYYKSENKEEYAEAWVKGYCFADGENVIAGRDKEDAIKLLTEKISDSWIFCKGAKLKVPKL